MDWTEPAEPEFPEIFEFTFGGWGCAEQLKWDGWRMVHILTLETGQGTPLLIPARKWNEFWPKLDQAKVWNWAPDYPNEQVEDGTQWSLEIKFKGKHIRSGGSNAYPGCDGEDFDYGSEFGTFFRAVRRLTGVKF